MAAVPLAKMGADMRRRMDRLSAATTQARPRAVRSGGVAAKDAHLAVIRKDVGSDLKMSGVGKKGRRVGVRFDEVDGGKGAVIRAIGPLHLVDRPTDARRIPKKRGKRARRRVITFAKIPARAGEARGFRSSAWHPGTPGKRTWSKGRKSAAPKITAAVAASLSESVHRAAR